MSRNVPNLTNPNKKRMSLKKMTGEVMTGVLQNKKTLILTR